MKELAICILASASICFAEITLPKEIEIDGISYDEVFYQSHDAAKVKFSHSSGISSVEISKLPPAIQSTLGYDESAAEEAMAAHAENQAAIKKAIADKRSEATRKIVEQDAGRLDNIAGANAETLQKNIRQAKAELKKVSREYEESVAQYKDRNTSNTTYDWGGRNIYNCDQGA